MELSLGDLAIRLRFALNNASVSQVRKALKNLKDDTDKAGSGISELGPIAKKAMGIVATAFSISAIKNFANECISMASDVEQMQQKFDVVYGNSAEAAEEWAADFADKAGRNVNTIKKYMSDAQNLLYGFASSYTETGQMTIDEAREFGLEMSENMTRLAMDIASFSNMNEDSAINAMTKAVQGETECAKTLGAVLNDTTRELAMQELGIEGTYDALDQLTKMQVNYEAIRQQSTDAIGDLTRSNAEGLYESRARMTQARMEELKEYIGTQLLPAYQLLQAGMYDVYNTLLKIAKALLENEDGESRIVTLINAAKVAMNYLMVPLRSLYGMIRKLADAVGGWNNLLEVAAVAFTTFMIALKWGKIIAGIKSVGLAIKGLFSLSSLKLMAIVALVVAIFLVVQDFFTFMQGGDSVIGDVLNKMGIDADDFRAKVKTAFKAVGAIFQWLMDLIKAIFTGDWEDVKAVMDKGVRKVVTIFVKLVMKIGQLLAKLGKKISAKAKAIFANFAKKCKEGINNAKDAIKEKFEVIEEFFKSLPDKALQWGKDMIDGFIDGIKEKAEGVKSAVSTVGEKISSVIHFSRPDEGPLRDYEEWMPDMMEGLAAGIENNRDVVIGKVRALAQDMQLLMQSASASAASMMSTVNNNKSITQNVSISNSYSGTATETAKKITGTMKKSSVDATTQMARALQYARA